MKDVPIYREPIDGSNDVVYVVKKGSMCTFGREVIKKAFLFKQVTCNGAQGWTPDWADFEAAKQQERKQ